jgi:DegV family protein with EDD domain
MLSLDIEVNNQVYPEGKEIKIARMPPSIAPNYQTRLVIPNAEKLHETFSTLTQNYDQVLVIFMSDQLSPLYHEAELAIAPLQSHSNITLINSQTISVGLGILVQLAADLLEQGTQLSEAERQVRRLIPHIYTLLCSPGLTYLHQANILDHAQATIGEMLNLYPLFTIEEGSLTPIEKVRNYRSVLDSFQEFLGEFDHLRQIAFLQGVPPLLTESRILRQFAQENYPQTPYSEHTINAFLATLIGPRCLGMVTAEDIPLS